MVHVLSQESEIKACSWLDPKTFFEGQATIMPPGTLYYTLNRRAVAAAQEALAAATAPLATPPPHSGLAAHELPMGFRPGKNRAYMIDEPALASKL